MKDNLKTILEKEKPCKEDYITLIFETIEVLKSTAHAQENCFSSKCDRWEVLKQQSNNLNYFIKMMLEAEREQA